MHIHELEKEAVEKALDSNNRRLDEMNQLRLQITQERGDYMTKDLFNHEHRALSESIDARLKTLETSNSYRSGQLWVIGAILVLAELAIHFIGKR